MLKITRHRKYSPISGVDSEIKLKRWEPIAPALHNRTKTIDILLPNLRHKHGAVTRATTSLSFPGKRTNSGGNRVSPVLLKISREFIQIGLRTDNADGTLMGNYRKGNCKN